jgi:hypothetical protein
MSEIEIFREPGEERRETVVSYGQVIAVDA